MNPRTQNPIFANWLTKGCAILFLWLFFASAVSGANPYARSDNSWITISGTVQSVKADAFTLGYGTGEILVEMDDGDRDADGYKLLPGDKVSVTGLIDKDLLEKTTIEASTVYVEKIGTTFFASAVDEEDIPVTINTPIVFSTVIYGPVIRVSSGEFQLGRGEQSLTIDVTELPYNPFDDEGYQKIEPGDYVKVDGVMKENSQEGRRFVANSVVELFK